MDGFETFPNNKLEQNQEESHLKESKRIARIADELNELQTQENDGRGVSCVRTAITYLRRGKIEEAKRVCDLDHDKISSYPKLVEYIKDNLFKDEKY